MVTTDLCLHCFMKVLQMDLGPEGLGCTEKGKDRGEGAFIACMVDQS